METISQPMKKALSREELLLKWREQRKANQQNQQCPRNVQLPASSHSSFKATALRVSSSSSPSYKQVKVRVRRFNRTPNMSSGVRLYEQGTVAWCLKSKHHPPNRPGSHPHPSTLPKPRTNKLLDSPVRRKSEPNRAVRVLQERPSNLPGCALEDHTPTIEKVDSPIHYDMMIDPPDNWTVSPMSTRS